MSRPEPVPLCRRSGITLLEAMLVLSLFSFLTAASFQALNSTSEASRRLDAVNRVHVRSQLVLDRVVAEAAASVRIYGDDSEGWSVLSLLQGVTGEMLPDSKLPALLNDGIVEKDLSGAIDTGNCLVVLKAILPFGLKSTTTTDASSTHWAFWAGLLPEILLRIAGTSIPIVCLSCSEVICWMVAVAVFPGSEKLLRRTFCPGRS